MAKAATAVKDKNEESTDGTSKEDSKKQVQSVEFAETAEGETVGSGSSIDILLDMNIPVTVTVGQTVAEFIRI